MTTEHPEVPDRDLAGVRLARLYRASAEIRSAIARARDAREMLAVACRVAVDVAGYRMAYAGLVDEASPDGEFVVVASAGDDFGWVDGVRAALNPDAPSGGTIGGRALQLGHTTVVDDLAALPPTAHRPRASAELGLRSLVMLPLRVADRTIGGMAVYATEPRAFGTAEVALIERTMAEISFELERLERDEQLRASEERYRLLVQEASEAMLVSGPEGRFVDANEAATRLTGFSRDELLAMDLRDLSPPEADVAESDLAQLRVGEIHRANYPILCRDGTAVWVELTATRLQDGRLQGLLRDITARLVAEARADRLMHLYAATADIDRAIRGITDQDALFAEACRVAVEAGGFRLAAVCLIRETPGRPLEIVAARGPALGFVDLTPTRALLDPPPGTPPMRSVQGLLDDRPIVLDIGSADDPAAARQFGLQSAAVVPLHVGIRVVGCLAVYAGVADAFDRAEMGLVERIADDVSFRLDAIERDAARRSAEAERDRLALAIEQGTEAVFIAEPATGRIIYVNGAFERLTGHAAAEAVGTRARSWLADADNGPEVLAGILASQRAGTGWSGEVSMSRPDGTRRRVAVSTTLLRDAAGAVTNLVTVMRDVTSQRELEDQLRQAQKMEAVGRLAGGVAHDFNNLLTAILGYASLARMELGEGPVAQDIAAIEQTAERAADLTRQLLAFARQSPLVRTVFSPDELLTDLVPMLRRLIGEDIELEIARPGAEGRITGDATQIQQAVINLVVNARDAMPDGGTIRIATSDIELDAGFVAGNAGASEGPHVCIAVSDTGTGIPDELLGRIFDPFFTTKEQGRGTGLGLSMVLGTVQSSGGSIAVASEPGRGTTFRVFLPSTDDAATPALDAQAPVKPGLGIGRTVLVIEDEDALRGFAVRVLEQAGFTVLEARNGDEAVTRVAGHEGRLDVIVTDVVMPGPTGPVTVERIRAMRPGVPALFVTGYASRTITAERGLGTAVLQKPYRGQALLARIEALLASIPPGRAER